MAQPTPRQLAFANKIPQQLFTSGYLDDPIQFTNDARFDPEVIIREEDFYATVTRDDADFGLINLAASAAVYYPVTTISPLYDRVKYTTQLKQDFKTF